MQGQVKARRRGAVGGMFMEAKAEPRSGQRFLRDVRRKVAHEELRLPGGGSRAVARIARIKRGGNTQKLDTDAKRKFPLIPSLRHR